MNSIDWCLIYAERVKKKFCLRLSMQFSTTQTILFTSYSVRLCELKDDRRQRTGQWSDTRIFWSISANSDETWEGAMMRSITARDRVGVGIAELKIFKFCFASIHSASRWPHELLVTSCQLKCLAFRSPISIKFRLYRCNRLRISIGTSSECGE